MQIIDYYCDKCGQHIPLKKDVWKNSYQEDVCPRCQDKIVQVLRKEGYPI